MNEIVESKTPILVLSYQNCELYCCHLDGYKQNKNALQERMLKIESEFLMKPSHAKFRIWYNIDENVLDEEIIKQIIKSITNFQEHIHKIAFVGLSGIAKWRFKHLFKQTIKVRFIPVEYFTDADAAKKWLI